MEEKTVLCPACGAEMELKLKDFSIGADGARPIMALMMDQYDVDLYACSQCGKVELYTAGFQKKEESEDGLEEGREGPEPPASQGGGLFGFGKKKEKRPSWEK